MAKKHKQVNITKRDVQNLGSISPVYVLFLIGFVLGAFLFCGGSSVIFTFTHELENNLGLSNNVSTGFRLFSFAILVILCLAMAIGMPIAVSYMLADESEKRPKGIQITNIDSMSGIEFEAYLKKLLIRQGYNVALTQTTGDLGVDLVASKNGDRIAIQAKRYNSKISRRAISDAVAGMRYYNCNKAMVITNNYFSPGAISLADANSCILIDRKILIKWVNELQNIDDRISSS